MSLMNGRHEKGNPLGIMPKLKNEPKKPSKSENEPPKPVTVAEPEVSNPVNAKPRYTHEELRKGLEVGVVLGAPRAREPFRIGKRAK